MKYTFDSEAISQAIEVGAPLFTAKTSCVAMGNPLLLAAFCHMWFIRKGMLAGYTTESEALKGVSELKPDFLFVGDALEQGYAINLIKGVKEASPNTRCMLFTSRESVAVVRDAVSAGTDGVVFNSSVGMGIDGDFVNAMKAIATGGVYYPPEVRKVAGFEMQPMPDLSQRELDVLKELCMGHSNKAIAERLILSTDTVKGYVSAVIAKMGAEDRLSAVVKAIRMGF